MEKETKPNQVDSLMEEAMKSMKVVKRKRYPKIELSKDFISCLKNEIKDLRNQGLSDKVIIDRMSRAIPFHIDD